jgi:heparosan-N-sulfate-glucuronate 5-epimerase
MPSRRAFSVTVLTAAALFVAAPSAVADYGRSGPYLDYVSEPSSMPSGKLPRSHYSFGDYYTPIVVAQYGLKAHADYIATHRRRYRRDVLLAARWLVRNQADDGGWHYPFPWTVRGFDPIPTGWMSAMGQGQAMSLLWRAFKLKRQPAFRRAARQAVRPFRHPVSQGGLRADYEGLAWYEEYPTSRPSLVLNGYMFGLLGLYDMAPWSRSAARLYRVGVRTLRLRIARFDRPGGSWYMPDVPASRYYHRVHVVLLTAIESVSRSETLRVYRDRWWALH